MTDIRRLPKGFSLDVDPEATRDAPADLGDYLDDDPYLSVARSSRKKAKRRGKTTLAKPPGKVAGYIRPDTTEDSETDNVEAPTPEPKKAPSSRVRKQINMKPDTLVMFDELVQMIRSATNQYDASGAELQRAIVSIAYDARDNLDFKIEKRGRHGTGTAEAFDTSLKDAFVEALRKHLRRE